MYKTLNKNLTLLILIAIYLIYFWNTDAKFGFSPTDEARILGYIKRISNGDIPHLDFIFPHLAGTAYLYYFLNFLDTSVIFIQRLLGVINLAIYSYLFLRLSNENFQKQNLLIKFLLFFFSFNINIHVFSLYIWSTSDAILFSVFASFLISSTRKYKKIGFIVLGSIPILKSGFIFSTLFLFIYFILKEKFLSKQQVYYSTCFSIVPLLYIGFLLFNSGLNQMFFELFELPKFWNRWFTALGIFDFRLIFFTFLLTLPFYFIHKTFFKLDFIYLIFISTYTMVSLEDYSVIAQKPRFFIFSVFVLIAIVFQKQFSKNIRDFELPFLLCVLLGFSSTLSDGWAVSLWINGSILSLCLLLILSNSTFLNNLDSNFYKTNLLSIAMILILFTNIFLVNKQSRDNYNYRDLNDNNLLTYNLNDINKYYGNIYTSQQNYIYLSSMQECITSLDTKNIAVYPDNPYIYSMYDLNNPLIFDRYEGYFISGDYADTRLYENIDELNSSNELTFAILLQTYPASKIIEVDLNKLSVINDRNNVGFLPQILESINYIKSNLNGEIDTCNSFEIISKNLDK